MAFVVGGNVTRTITLVVFLASLMLLVRSYRRITGVWIDGFSAGRASRWAFAMGAVILTGWLLAFVIHASAGLVWPVVALGVAEALAVVYLGHRFDVALRDQLRAGA